jgi:alkanesulfonate monooxygenase SsuD/methylene tetrahydromethanopterin reductase-like flavin-dependent oxidoreductase (luciferase family)
MKFGLCLTGALQQPQGSDMHRRVQEVVEVARLAGELGYDFLYAGQHYLTHPYQMLQPLPVMARLAAEAPGMTLITTAVLPLHNPVDLAEQVASLDVITGGRAALAVVQGYRQEEFEAFGAERGHRVPRMLEALELLRRLWTEEEVTFHGRHFRVTRAHIGIRPLQRPHPPIWFAANSDAAVERAGRLGYPWYINPHSTTATILRQAPLYRRALQEASHPPPTVFPALRECFVAPTREEALEACRPYLAGKYDTYAQWGQDRALPGHESFQVPFQELARGRFIIGDAEDAVAELERYRALGVTHAGLRMRWPGMPLEPTLRSMRLVAEQVMPRFRDAG